MNSRLQLHVQSYQPSFSINFLQTSPEKISLTKKKLNLYIYYEKHVISYWTLHINGTDYIKNRGRINISDENVVTNLGCENTG